MTSWLFTDHCTLIVQSGDITHVADDAIVNAANTSLLGGGGVDGAIHRAAGPELLATCRALPADHGVRCRTAQARLTPAFKLPARVVIHTVGPVYHRVSDPAALLAQAHRSCLDLATQHDLSSIAFPAISCGVYGYPPDKAARVAIDTCIRACGDPDRDTQTRTSLRQIRFVLFSARTYDAWMQAATHRLGTACL
ncbi:MAG: O-acetyl-ADP-ribose deacetylase [Oligoflexia bacterium]|nr:O-acetyl-ADP-ribose deacetylase [Oligoflexia bacterium]